MFIGRKKELEFLEERYKREGAELIVLYGRRRIGKTELLREFCVNKPHVFYSCREFADEQQLDSFSQRILESGHPASQYVKSFSDWEAALSGVMDISTNEGKRLLIIDEFPYMCKANDSIPSILQVLWDEKLRHNNIMIVLCGSAMSFIENEVLSERKPLYGRTTGIYKMNELPFSDVIKFFPDYSDEDLMITYSILGGIPHYLKQFDPNASVEDNIIRNILTKGCALYSEVEFLMRQELREPVMYNTLLEAIALGNTQLGEIHSKTQVESSKISVYLKNLIQLRLLEREFSILASNKELSASTKGVYRISDNFFRFWYKFILPNLSDLEMGDAKGVYTYVIKPRMNDFSSPVFEEVCKTFIRKLNHNMELPYRLHKFGRWWGKVNRKIEENGKVKFRAEETEIDILGFDEGSKNYFVGECKYKNSKVELIVLEQLKEKVECISRSKNLNIALFSKSGFTKGVEEKENEKECTLYTLKDIVAYFKKSNDEE